MPNINDLPEQQVIKMLLMAEQGSGKTCALAALANVGYNVRIIDFDNKVRPMRSYLRPDAAARVHYVTCTDNLTTVGHTVVSKGTPQATIKAMSLLTNWRDGDVRLGPVSTWGDDTVLVIDSLTFQGRSAMRYVKALAQRDGQQPLPGDWGAAQQIQLGLLEMLYSEAIHCHVIVISHVTYLGGVEEGSTGFESQQGPNPFKVSAKENIEPGAPIKGYPSGLGRAVPPHVGEFFDSVLHVDVRTIGGRSRRFLETQAKPYMALKNPAPRVVPKEIELKVDENGYAVEGLAKFFELVLSEFKRRDSEVA